MVPIFETGPRPLRKSKRRKGDRLDIVRQFFRILRKLKFGCTIEEIQRDEVMSRRTVHRWLSMVDELFGLEKYASGPGQTWVYRVSRDKIREAL